MKPLRALISVVSIGLVPLSIVHADPNQSGPDLRYGGNLITFQPALTVSRQIGQVDVHDWNRETIDVEIERAPIAYRTGSEDITVRRQSGLQKYTNIQLQWPRYSGSR